MEVGSDEFFAELENVVGLEYGFGLDCGCRLALAVAAFGYTLSGGVGDPLSGTESGYGFGEGDGGDYVAGHGYVGGGVGCVAGIFALQVVFGAE